MLNARIGLSQYGHFILFTTSPCINRTAYQPVGARSLFEMKRGKNRARPVAHEWEILSSLATRSAPNLRAMSELMRAMSSIASFPLR